MKRKGKIWLFVVAIAIFVLAYTTVAGVSTRYGDNVTEIVKSVSEIRFGIDISGGVEVTFSPVIETTADETGEEEADTTTLNVTEEDLNAAQAVMEQRLATLGITDYELYKDTGNGRLILRFPWKENEDTYDPETAIAELGATAMLTFREGYEYDSTTGEPSGTTAENIILQGSDVASATAAVDQSGTTAQYVVQLKLTDEGAEKFAEATARLAEEAGTISIWLDNSAISAPTVNEAITGGEAVITGSFTAEQAQSLADTINAGSLPFAMQAESYSTISSALGTQALKAMVFAGIVAFLLVALFMIFNYKMVGAFSAISLLGQVAGTLAFVSGYFAVFSSTTLTLPGIAGIILAIGMGVDANIITNERIKEELRSGKNLDNALRAAFKRGIAPIIDGNITIVIVAVILIGAFGPTDTIFAKILYPVFFAFGSSTTGTIYSFGYTLLVGVLLNFVFGLGANRVMITSASKFNKLRNPVLYGGLKPGVQEPQATQVQFVKNRKRTFSFVGIVLAAIIACTVIFGVSLSVEFKGGTIITYSYTGIIDKAEFEDAIAAQTDTSLKIQEGSDTSTGGSLYTVTFANTLSSEQVAELEAALAETYEANSLAQKEISNVSATMGREFLAKCLVAVLLAAVLILIYIGYRFRKIGGWVGGITAIAALLFDLCVVYGTFVVLQAPLDGNFIAALLVILGYSINSTVVIYDRVRENRSLFGKSMSFDEALNLSINQSMGRSIKTTLTTVIALACVCIFALVYGMDSIFTFVFPMAMGMVSGAFTSLCVAGPLWSVLRARKGKKTKANK